ncbi:MAG: DUF3300 domain-containing protein [Pseudomonadota bacterium]
MPVRISLTLALASLLASTAGAQVPVDEDGQPIGTYSSEGAGTADFATADDALLSVAELSDLVAPIALYPDDLLAIVLPASTFPLQIVEASRFLEAVESDSDLTPDDDWDDSVVALLNYPEVVELLNEDLDWTWALGEAVVAQQADILTAVNDFRSRARAAGNLETDDYQRIEENDEGIIEIEPLEDDVIYVPYYEPERVVVYQTRPVYHYYRRAYPVYYYPYPDYYVHYRPFWGVTTAFSIGWISHSLHVRHHSYYGHPYYGHFYRDRWWYRRPSVSVFHSRYYGGHGVTRRHYRYGDYWQPRYERRLSRNNQRITRSYGARDVRRSTPPRYGFSRSQQERHSDSRSNINRQATARSTSQQRPSTVQNRSRSQFASPNRRETSARSGQTRSPETRPRTSTSTSQRRSESARVQADRSATRQTRQTRQGFSNSQRRSESYRPQPAQRSPSANQRSSTPARQSVGRVAPSTPSVRREPAQRQSFSSRPSQRQSAPQRSAPRPSSRPSAQRSGSFSAPSRNESRRSAPSQRRDSSRRESSRRR